MPNPEAPPEKRKRSRPKVMSDAVVSLIETHHGRIKTDRARQNAKYMYHAMNVLDLRPNGTGQAEFGWLIDWIAADKYRRGAIKAGILVELGRLAEVASPDIARRFAAIICKRKPSIKEGIAYLKRKRLEAGATPSDFEAWCASKRDDTQLFGRLAIVIDQYRVEHPEITNDELLAVLDRLFEAVANLSSR